jgi:hypothetical protein
MTRLKRASQGRPGVSNWAEAAEYVRTAMAFHPSPPIESAIKEIPSELLPEHGHARPTAKVARRWITVLQQLERLEDVLLEEFATDVAKLREHPVACAELICRWERYDPETALDAAKRVLNGELTVEKLRLEEKEARQSNVTRVVGRQYAYQLHRLAERWASVQLEGFKRVVTRGRHHPPGDFLFERESPRSTASVLIHGPYKNVAEYEIRRVSFLGLVVGTAACVDRVIALVPDRDLQCWDWLAANNIAGTNIEFFQISSNSTDFEPIKLERDAGDV